MAPIVVLVLGVAAILAVAIAVWHGMRKEDRVGWQSQDPTAKADWMRPNF